MRPRPISVRAAQQPARPKPTRSSFDRRVLLATGVAMFGTASVPLLVRGAFTQFALFAPDLIMIWLFLPVSLVVQFPLNARVNQFDLSYFAQSCSLTHVRTSCRGQGGPNCH